MKEFQNITKKQIEQNGVQALSDRPNSVGAYGSGGLSPLELKLAFDRLATLIAEKINEIHKVLASAEAGQYIRLAMQEQGIETLAELVESIRNGSFASILRVKMAVSDEEMVNLQNAIYQFSEALIGVDGALAVAESAAKRAEEAADLAADVASKAGTSFAISDTKPIATRCIWFDTSASAKPNDSTVLNLTQNLSGGMVAEVNGQHYGVGNSTGDDQGTPGYDYTII
jgi:hypothetical protein